MTMATLTVKVPEHLAEQVQPFSHWLATILELSLLQFETQTSKVVAEIIAFLASNPSVAQVKAMHLFPAAKERLKRLMVLNDAEALTTEENKELDELERLESLITLLKLRLAAYAPC